MAEEEHSSKRSRISDSDSASLGSSESLIPGLIDDVALKCLALVSRLDYPSLSCVNKTYYKLINSGDLLAQRKNLEYLVFMLRHLKGCKIFSPMQEKWLVLPNIPNDEWIKTSLVIRDELWVFGAELFKFTIWKFSLKSGCWVKCKDMNCPRRSFASGSLGGIAIVAGGIDRNSNILASAELYDSSTGRWERLPNMHTPRRNFSGFFMDGKFYVIGGISNLHSLTCGEEFDMETRTWRKIEGMYPNLNPRVKVSSSFAVVNDELFALGFLSYILMKYNKANKIWEAIGMLPPSMVDSSYGWEREIKACGDQLFVFRKKEGKGIVVHSWCPKSTVKDGYLDLEMVGFNDDFSCRVWNFNVMRC